MAFTPGFQGGGMRATLCLFASLALTHATLAQTVPLITSWQTASSGKYARQYSNTANRSSGTSTTTWTGHTNPSYSDVYEVWYDNNYAYVKYTGLPSYVIGPWLQPDGKTSGTIMPATQSVIRRFPRSPTVPASTAKNSVAAGTSGLLVNGVHLFNNLDGQAWDGSSIVGGAQHTNGTYYWHRVAPVAESYNFDYGLGHSNPAGAFHNHQNPLALRYQIGDHVDYNSSTKVYSESATTPTQHSPILGWTHDGYPVYGPYGYSTATSSSSGIRRMVSGYVKRDGTTTGADSVITNNSNMPQWYLRYRTNHSLGGTTNPVSVARSTDTSTYPIGTFAQDYSYLGDLIKSGTTYYAQGTDFDLDEYNGRYCVTPEYPSGTYAYFITIDSSGNSTFPYILNFEHYGAATQPYTVSSIASGTNYVTAGPATAISYPSAASAASGTVSLTWNSVEGSTYQVDASTNQSTWTSRQSSVAAASSATQTSASFSTIGSSGTEYARVTRTALATYDVPSVASTVTTTQTATTSYSAGTPVNTAPTLTSISTLSGATKNSAFTISYTTLFASSDAADSNGDTLSFRVEAVSSGTLTKNGTAVTAGSTLISSGDSVVWTPAANASGTLAAFTVKAWDGALASSTAVQVNVTVSSNTAPTLSAISTLTGAVEDTAYTLSYSTLFSASNAADANNDTLSFRIEVVSSGTLTKSGTAVTAGSTMISSGDSVVWTPAANANGTLAAFTVTAYDGAAYSSTPVQVNISTSAVNDTPTLTTLSTLTGATAATAFTITYTTLSAASNAADVDGDSVQFRIEAVSSGTLTKNGTTVTAGSTTLASGESLVWTSAAGASGTVAAFSVKAYDGTAASSTAVAVNITLSTSDPQLTSWYVAQSGKYARITETETTSLAGTTETTWTRTTGPFTLSQSKPVYAGPQQVDYSASWIYLRTPSLATYVMGPWYNDATRSDSALFINVPTNQGSIVKLPRTSTLGSIPTTKTRTAGFKLNNVLQQACGWYVDGVSIFDPNDGFGYQNGSESSPATGSWHRDAYVNESITFDKGLAHQQNLGTYHNHANPIGLRYQLGDAVAFNSTTKAYSETLSPTKHSPIIGWMLDGLPVHGPYGYSSAMSASSGVRRMVGGFVKRNGATTGVDNISTTGSTRTLPSWATRLGLANTNGPNVSTTYPFGRYIEDWAYLGDLVKTGSTKYQQGTDFDLNEYNVRYCVTPEFPSGTWAYFLNIDSTGTPQFPYMCNIWFYGTPTGGTVTSVSETVANQFSGGANRALNISSASASGTSVSLAWDAVEGATYSVDASTDGNTWTSKASGVTISNANTGASSYTALVSNGTERARVQRTALATYDTTGTVSATVSQTATTTYNVSSNTAPTLTSIDNINAAGEDASFTLSYDTMAAACTAYDAEGNPISFRVESLVSGSLTKNGSAVVAGSTLLGTGESLVWTPASNANGNIVGFTVKAWDGTLASNTALNVTFYVAPVNDAPTLTTISSFSGTEDSVLTINYSTLLAASDAADVDYDALSFVIQSVSSGTLTKNGVAVTPGSTLISSGDSVVWTPDANANGLLSAFTVQAWDGSLLSAGAVQVSVNATAVNDAPTMNTYSETNHMTPNTSAAFLYSPYLAATSATDVDGDTIQFLIVSVPGGTLTKNGVAVTPGVTTFANGEELEWTPPANATGTFTAFTAKAYDGTSTSANTLTVYMSVQYNFAGWAAKEGLSGASAAQDADPDNDGIANALEFVFGLDPTKNNASSVSSSLTGGYLTMTFPRARSTENDMVMAVEVSTDLTTWATYWIGTSSSTTADGLILTVTDAGGGMDSITVQVPAGTNTRLFTRVRAEED